MESAQEPELMVKKGQQRALLEPLCSSIGTKTIYETASSEFIKFECEEVGTVFNPDPHHDLQCFNYCKKKQL